MNEAEFAITRTVTVPIRQYVNDGFMITQRWEKKPSDKEIEEWNEKSSALVKKMYMQCYYEAVQNENEAKEEPKKNFIRQAGPAKKAKQDTPF